MAFSPVSRLWPDVGDRKTGEGGAVRMMRDMTRSECGGEGAGRRHRCPTQVVHPTLKNSYAIVQTSHGG